MNTRIFPVCEPEEYRRAGSTDLIELIAAPNSHPLFIRKWVLESLVYAIASHEFIHLSGPTGSAKTSLLDALYLVPENFSAICAELGLPQKPLRIFPVEMATFETPGEIYQRRALKNGTTYDELSPLVRSLQEISSGKDECYPLIWLREIGRVHSSSVQGGLLNLMTPGDIILPEGTRICGAGIAWIADSNYQAQSDSNHSLVSFDDALKRRFSVNITLDYLPADLEAQVMERLLGQGYGIGHSPEQISNIVTLSQVIRRHRAEGAMRSMPPPTISGYLSYFRMAHAMPHLSQQQVLQATLLGNATTDDQKLIPRLLAEVFGVSASEDGRVLEEHLF
jgi:energy-coupling factor transporter ATP-binding protein EcfA2